MANEGARVTPFQAELTNLLKELRREIYSGIRLPRERLVENSLAKTFDVSRMVVRQALMQLETEGMVTIEPYKGAAVAEISLAGIFESYQVVAMLEGFAAMLSAERLEHEDLNGLKRNLDEQRALEIENVQDWQKLNHKFHRDINLKCGNQRLIEMIRQNCQFTSYWFIVLSAPGRISTNIEEHEAILAAFEQRDGESARRLTESHIISAGHYLVDFMRKNVPVGMWRDCQETT